MTYLVAKRNGLELCDSKGNVIASAKKNGAAFPIGEVLKGQEIPGNLILDLNADYRKVAAIQKPPVTFIQSPNYSYRNSAINMIILHHTVGSLASAITTFKSVATEVSAHYIIAKNGDIIQMVNDKYKAWHAGNDNPGSIGIEHEAFDGDNLTAKQAASSIALCKWLMKEYNIPKSNVTGHRFAPNCTTGTACPGALFGARTEDALRQWVDKNL